MLDPCTTLSPSGVKKGASALYLLRAERQDPEYPTWHLMCPVCGALPGTSCVQDGQEQRALHPSRRLSIQERNRRAAAGWVPPELAVRRAQRPQPPALPQAPAPARVPAARRTPRRSSLAEAVMRFLASVADQDGVVRLPRRQVAVGCGYVTATRPWDKNRKARMAEVMRTLRLSGQLQVLATPTEPGGPETLQIKGKRNRRKPANDLTEAPLPEPLPAPCPAARARIELTYDPRMRAFDECAARWPEDRRKTWRSIWMAVLTQTTDGYFDGDPGTLADLASDHLDRQVTPQTVTQLLRWSVATRLTDQIRPGDPSRFQIRAVADDQRR
ncbi:hypothetical protein [Actinomadura sp. K4S16]|uniref:hypothetical protein n=1 Tax=Actinomadura sp. K4S16 TaxID=1316147 RepID=UPI0011EF72FA|nr:hypothetical protein [Actinomadura sp. K4S16]